MRAYYDTVGVDDLPQRTEKAQSQEAVILDFFRSSPMGYYTPFEVMRHTGLVCINSVRRAMTNLTKRGLLRKTSVTVVSEFGHKNRTWKLN